VDNDGDQLSYNAVGPGPGNGVDAMEFESYLLATPGTIIETVATAIGSVVTAGHIFTVGQATGSRVRWLISPNKPVSGWSAEKPFTF